MTRAAPGILVTGFQTSNVESIWVAMGRRFPEKHMQSESEFCDHAEKSLKSTVKISDYTVCLLCGTAYDRHTWMLF